MVPLDKKYFSQLTERVRAIPFNTLFAQAVTERMVTGRIVVDDPHNIRTAYIVHPYGMTLMLGESDNENFLQSWKRSAFNTDGDRSSFEWMQAHPSSWDEALRSLFGEHLIPSDKNTGHRETGIIELNTRVNFTFDLALYRARTTVRDDRHITLMPTTRQQYRQMNGSVVPQSFWDNEEDLFSKGMAFSLLYDGMLASMAFSSCKIGDTLELGIETIPAFRGKGLAEIVCAALIDYCIEHRYEPVWACRKENRGSYALAQKIGFRPTLELPYYRLSK